MTVFDVLSKRLRPETASGVVDGLRGGDLVLQRQ